MVKMKITDCKVNQLTDPLGFDLEHPSFSWKVTGAQGRFQTAARLLICADSAMTLPVYDSGFAPLDSLCVRPELLLTPRTSYFWTVTVRTDADEDCTGPVCRFETAKLDEPWVARWIGCDRNEPRHPIFTKSLALPDVPVSARLYICGLGLYEVSVNSRKVGDEFFAPFCNDYNSWLQYQTYDLTGLLTGEDTLSVLLGNGWYGGRYGFDSGPEGKPYYGDDWKLIAELHLTYSDGRTEVLCSDESWQVERSGITFSNLYDGEHADATLPPLTAVPARLIEAPSVPLRARKSVPVTVHEQFPVAEVIHTPAGETVLDIGQNITGIFRLQVHVPRGEAVHLQFGEIMQQGCFYRENLRTAKAEYIWISDGEPHVLEPKFTFYGYRYVKVSGVPGLKAEDFTAAAVYSHIPEIGTLTTGHPLVNRLILNAIWGQKDNFLDIPTDCPQRDERMGWTGDAQVFAPTACCFSDCTAFYDKFLTDMAYEQRALGGMIPHVIPSIGIHECACVWGDAAVIIPWTVYRASGDRAFLARHFDMMAAWVDFVTERYDAGSWLTQFHFGDWLAMDGPGGGDGALGGTDEPFIALAYLIHTARLTARSAAVLDMPHQEAQYQALADRVLEHLHREYYSPSGRCCVNTQTAHLLTIALDLHPNREKATAGLLNRLEWAGGKLSTGFVGTPFLCPVLSMQGHHREACKLLFNEELPGWLYAVKLGATTIWERWNSVLPDGTISPSGMNSLNHYSYGSIAQWLWQWVAGIRCDQAGYRTAVLAPMPSWHLGSIDAVCNSAAGRYEVHWKCVDQNHLCVSVTVPFGCTARLELPLAPDSAYTAGRTLTAGEYTFAYETTEPLYTTCHTGMSIKDLLAEPKVAAELLKLMPEAPVLPTFVQVMSPRQAAAHLGSALDELDRILAQIPV